MRHVLPRIAMAVAMFAVSGALASNLYSVLYTGDALPEVQDPNWHRYYNYSGDVRTIEPDPDIPGNNLLVLNSLGSSAVYDYGRYSRQMNPGVGEVFVAEWRAKVLEEHSGADQGVSIHADDGRHIGFYHGYDFIEGFDGNFGWSMAIEPGAFHTYRVESSSMAVYRLWIDGQLSREAPFFEGTGTGGLAFGDESYFGGPRSVVAWDYVAFGVYQVPEAASMIMLLCLCAGVGHRRK